MTSHRANLIFLSIVLVAASAIMWDPYFLSQEMNFFEWGLYLPGIDAVSQGQVPFRDFFHLRGPFELYAPAFFMKTFGFRADVLAAYFYLGTVLTILTGILIAYEIVQSRVLLGCLAMVLVLRTFPRVVFTFWGGMRYAWGLMAVYCLIRFLKSKHPGWLVAGGCLAAIGWWTSIEIGVICLLTFAIVLFPSHQWRRGSWAFIGGFLAISVPYGIYLLSQNALGPYAQAQWVVVTHMGKTFLQSSPVPDSPSKFLHAIFFPLDKSFYQMTPMYCYFFFFIYYFWRMRNKKTGDLEQSALAVAVYGLLLFLTGFRNLWASEYEMALQPEKILLFYLLGTFILGARQKFKDFKWIVPALLAAVILSTGIYTVGRFKTRFIKFSWIGQLMTSKAKGKADLINGAAVTPIHFSRISHMTVPVWQAKDLEGLLDFVDKHVPAHETVWMYPELGSLNFILQRPWPGRFPVATLSWLDDRWFDQYETTLASRPPAFAIVNKEMPSYFDSVYFLVPGNRDKHRRMMRFLHEHYLIEGQTPTYFIYRRIN